MTTVVVLAFIIDIIHCYLPRLVRFIFIQRTQRTHPTLSFSP